MMSYHEWYENQLLPCHFCGGKISDYSYDRRYVFKCEPCGIQWCFDGLITTVKNDRPIPYKRTVPNSIRQELKEKYFPKWFKNIFPVHYKDEPVPPEEVKYQEYYHHENTQKAIDGMNKIIKEKMEEFSQLYNKK